jgi:pyruvate,orthophosphate dikinase
MAEQKKQWVYYFGEVGIENKGLVGGKGAGLSEMVKLDLPIPTGFTISTEACNYFSKNKKWPEGLEEQVDAALKQMEQKSGHVFGDATNPLLVSVRSGAKISMPGMMDTVLNLGLTPEICEGFAKKANPRFAKDSYRRFIQMFGDVVKGVEHHNFEHIISTIKKEKNVEFDVDLTADDLDELIKRYKEMYKKTINEDFPNNPKEQLNAAINAVFESWDNKLRLLTVI